MPLGRKARGKANATQPWEARQIFRLGNLSKKDNFCDLGCGHGRVVIWAAKKCKFAWGIEDYSKRYKRAVDNVLRKDLTNTCILYGNYLKSKLSNANFLYCVNTLDLADFRRWDKEREDNNLRIVTFGPPPVPIKPARSQGLFFLTEFPFKLAKTPSEWFLAVVGRKSASWNSFKAKFRFNRSFVLALKKEFNKNFETMRCKGCNEDIDDSFIIVENNALLLNHALQNEIEKILPWELGHLVLMPRKRSKKWQGEYHAVDISKLSDKEWNEIHKFLPKIVAAMKKVLPKIKKDSIHRIYLVTFNESEDWHFHIHLVPRYKHGRRKGRDLLVGRKLSKNDISRVVKELQRELRHQ